MGFAAPLMLIFAAAAAVPYLLQRRRRSTQATRVWSANRFLTESMPQQRRRSRLLWLLLLLRIAAVLALALAVADPFLRSSRIAGGETAASPAGQPLWIYAVDGSPSMRLQASLDPAAESLWQMAIDAASSHMLTRNDNDLVAIVLLQGGPKLHFRGSVAQAKSTDPFRQLRAKAAATESELSVDTDAVRAMLPNWVKELRRASTGDAVGWNAAEVRLYSDFSRHEWSADTLSSLSNDLRTLPAMLTPVQVQFQAQPRPRFNLSVTKLQARGTRQQEKSDAITYGVTIENTGVEDFAGGRLRWWLDGRSLDIQNVDVPSKQSIIVETTIATAEGLQRLKAQLDTDQMPSDDTRYAIVPPRRSNEVVVLATSVGDTLPLAVALESLGFEVQTAVASQYDWSRDDPVIHWIDPSIARTDAAATLDRLHAAVTRGASICWWLGPAIDAESWTRAAGSAVGLQVLPTVKLERVDWGFGSLAAITSAVNDRPATSRVTAAEFTAAIPLSKYWRPSSPLRSGWRPFLELAGNHPFAVERQIAQGRIACIVTPPLLPGREPRGGERADGELQDNESWNAMVTWPDFVPLADRIMKQLREAATFEQTVGEQIAVPAVGQRAWVVTSPSGETGTRVDRDGADAAGSLVVATETGVYTLRATAVDEKSQLPAANEQINAAAEYPVAVNFDAAEMHFDALSSAEITLSEGPGGAGGNTADDAQPSDALKDALGSSMRLFRYLVIGSIAALLCENLLSAALTRRARGIGVTI